MFACMCWRTGNWTRDMLAGWLAIDDFVYADALNEMHWLHTDQIERFHSFAEQKHEFCHFTINCRCRRRTFECLHFASFRNSICSFFSILLTVYLFVECVQATNMNSFRYCISHWKHSGILRYTIYVIFRRCQTAKWWMNVSSTQFAHLNSIQIEKCKI